MKKRSLLEEIKRIQEITYGEKDTKDGFVGNVLREQTTPASNMNNAQKADAANKDDQGNQVADPKLVENFYSTFDKAIAAGGISQKQVGSMLYEKEVESMQIALVLLGYQLPQHGIDGLFGPETAGAVQKFATANNVNLGGPTTGTTKPMNEAVQLVSQGGGIIGRPGQGTHNASDWQSKNAWDITGPVGTEVKSLTTGTVSNFRKGTGGLVQSGVKKIFGDQVNIKSTDGKPDVFYTHIDSSLKIGDNVKEGDVIGKIIEAGGIDPHVHVGLSSGNLDSLASGLKNAGGGSTSSAPMIKATPEFLTKLLELVKGLNLTPEKLKEFMKKNIGSGGNGGVIDVKDFPSIINTIIDNLEGGYYNPDMLRDGRVTDSRYGASGETMFGIDRKTGPESNTPAGQKFWALIDAQPDKANWRNEYMAKDKPELSNQLRQLVAEMMKPFFEKYTKDYLSPESAAIVSKDPALTFHFVYATFNGSGWFQKFARLINNAVTSGNTDPKSLLALAMQDRVATNSSLMNQVGSKVAKITSKIQSSIQANTSTMA